jgi:hypothetical protein
MLVKFPLDMSAGVLFMFLGPFWGIFAFFIAVPLEAVLIKLFLDQSWLRSMLVSLAMNFVSSLFGAVLVILYGYLFGLIPFPVTVLLLFVGTVLIEFIFLLILIRPRISWITLGLFSFMANLISYPCIVVMLALFFVLASVLQGL